MQYNEERVRERIKFILSKHDITRNKFATLALLPESGSRAIFAGRRKVNLDVIYRLLLIHLKGSISKRLQKVAAALLDVLLSEEYKDDSLLLLLKCDLRQLTWKEINHVTGHAYYDSHLGQHLCAMREHGYGLSYRAMSFMDFAPAHCTIKSYEDGASKPSLEYFFGLLLKFRNPAKVMLYVMAPVNQFRAPGISMEHVLLYKRYLKITKKERKRLNDLARASNNKKRT